MMLYPEWQSAMSFEIADESAVGATRRSVVLLAEQHGLDADLRGRLAILATELAENLVRHAEHGGELFAQALSGPGGVEGLELVSVDRGPGMTDVVRCIQDGFSTVGGAGLGLSAIKRLSTGCWIDSVPGRGTVIVSRVLPAPAAGGPVQIGGLCAPHPNEDVCGDGWEIHAADQRVLFLLTDGLGHGPRAAEASRAAAEASASGKSRSAAGVLSALQAPLRQTRGAAVLIAAVDLAEQTLSVSGMGNVWGFTFSAGKGTHYLVCAGGIAGHSQTRAREETIPLERSTLLVMCTDGIHQRWRPAENPALPRRHPSLAAAMIYRDHARKNDDAAVLAARIEI